MNGLLRRLWRTLETGAALTLGLMAALVIYQVGARYLFGSPPSWTEELARFLQVWLVLLASPVCLRRGMHLAVDYVSPRLPPGARVALRTGVLLISAVFCLTFAVYGTRLLAVADLQTSPALGISMVWALSGGSGQRGADGGGGGGPHRFRNPGTGSRGVRRGIRRAIRPGIRPGR